MKFKMNKKGNSGIYIKPENRGKFTATKKATGKTTEELTHSKNPVTKKRAIFAQNAAKWKHQDGSRKISTPDSTAYYGKQMEKFMKKRSSVRIDKAPPYDLKANKAMSDMYRQTKKGKEGYDENGHPIAKKMQMGTKNTKSFPDLNKDGKVTKADILKGRGVIKNGGKSIKTDEKMCGSKGMKYQAGSKSMKATSDSTNYFRKKIVEESLKQPRGKFSSFSEESAKINRKINKLGEDLDRQELKGKPGYDANGYPLKKGVKKSSGASGDFANGTKSIKFKKKPMMKRADGSTSQRGLWDNIRANKGSGKKPTPEMLKQEKKIKAEGLKKK